MDHPLENLGPERFQHLCQALLIKQFPNLNCFPVGQPDGGRDAILRNTKTSETQNNSAIAFQVKFARKPPENITSWVIDAAKGEIDKIERLKKRGVTEYYFITNVIGTAHLDVGSIDTTQSALESLLNIKVTCYWRDDINRRLDDSWDIKLRYPETLVGQDILRLALSTNSQMRKRETTIKAFLAEQYDEDEEVKFKQVELQNKLLDLFVDLPFSLQLTKRADISLIEFHGEPYRLEQVGSDAVNISNSPDADASFGTASMLLQESQSVALDQVVIEGAPGQGKSTLAQYLCQVHRIRLLDKNNDFKKLPEIHKNSSLYIPFKVDLRDLSSWLSGNDPFATKQDSPINDGEARTLETFLTHLVIVKSGGLEFSIHDLVELSKITPLFIALDGLDEVADIKARQDVISAVAKASTRLRENCKRIRIAITSRPAAFAKSPGFDLINFPRIQLGSVRRGQIDAYANKWLDSRNLKGSERDEFNKILTEKLEQPHMRDLARNPMQLTILLSLVHTKGAALPDKRTTLYNDYVELFFSRESTKSSVVRQNRELLKDIHRFLAWKLHSAAETGKQDQATGRVSTETLREILREYLRAEGQNVDSVDSIFNALLERVVMIVSRIEGTYEFEVQPLREYFAAKYLYDTAPYSPPGGERTGTKPDIFDAVVRNFYWLNVARFFCGCFSKGELLDLADRLTDLIEDPIHGQSKQPARFAAVLLSDWVFHQSPKASSQILTLLAKRSQLFHLLPSREGIYYEDSIRVAQNGGGEQVIESSLEWIVAPETPSDLRARLGTFLIENVTHTDRTEFWSSKFDSFADIERGLLLGFELGVIGDIPPEVLGKAISGRTLTNESARLIWNAGKVGLLCDNSAHFPIFMETLKGTLDWSSEEEVDSPLRLLPLVLACVYLPGYMDLSPEGHRELYNIAQRYKVIQNKSITLGPAADLEAICVDISSTLLQQVDEYTNYNIQSFWKPIVAKLEIHFGTCLLTIVASRNLQSFAQGAGGRAKKVDLYDTSVSLAQRFRYAKLNSTSTEYWRTYVAGPRTLHGDLLWHVAFWTWAPLSVIFEMATVAQIELETLPESEWRQLLESMKYRGAFRGRERSAKPPILNTLDIASKRFAFLLAKREQNYATEIFVHHFLTDNSSLVGLNAFRLENAVAAAISGILDWSKALDIISEVYLTHHATHFSLYGLHRNKKALPKDAVNAILTKPFNFPCALVDIALASATAEQQKSGQPVGNIAKRDKWFQ